MIRGRSIDIKNNETIMVVTLSDHRVYRAKTPQQMVVRLWRGAWMTEAGPHQYMQAVAHRCRISGAESEVRTDTAVNFLADLVKVGLISYRIVPEKQTPYEWSKLGRWKKK